MLQSSQVYDKHDMLTQFLCGLIVGSSGTLVLIGIHFW